MADISVRSNQSILSRGARPESGRLHRKYPYRWLFDQVHVKNLIFHVEIGLLAVSIFGLYSASLMTSGDGDPISVPGFDGIPLVGNQSKAKGALSQSRPHYSFAKNALNGYSYFLIFSVISGLVGMRLSETSAARRNFPPHLNPASLLIPTAISVVSFLYPLSFWTLRTLHSTITTLIKENIRVSTVLDSCRLTLLPIIIIWAIFIYFLYGVFLGILYYQRRGDQPTPTTTSHNSPFRRPLRKTSQQSAFRFQTKVGCSNLLSDVTAVSKEHHSSAVPCASALSSASSSSPARHNRSVSPRGFRQLETVDEEAQSRSSSD